MAANKVTTAFHADADVIANVNALAVRYSTPRANILRSSLRAGLPTVEARLAYLHDGTIPPATPTATPTATMGGTPTPTPTIQATPTSADKPKAPSLEGRKKLVSIFNDREYGHFGGKLFLALEPLAREYGMSEESARIILDGAEPTNDGGRMTSVIKGQLFVHYDAWEMLAEHCVDTTAIARVQDAIKSIEANKTRSRLAAAIQAAIEQGIFAP